MHIELTQLKAGLETTLIQLATDHGKMPPSFPVSEAHLDLLAAEIARYTPDVAQLLCFAGKKAVSSHHSVPPLGAKAMIGFAKREGRPSRTTAEWMKEIREGEAA
jgi:hypothetical protein